MHCTAVGAEAITVLKSNVNCLTVPVAGVIEIPSSDPTIE